MGFISGALGASTGLGIWWVAQKSAGNLPEPAKVLMPVSLALFTVLVGFLVGAAIGRRASRRPDQIALFSTIASAFGGALIGASLALAVTGAYLASYGSWPEDTAGRILFVLAFPAFGGLGWFAGAAAGSVVGLTGGAILRLLGGARR